MTNAPVGNGLCAVPNPRPRRPLGSSSLEALVSFTLLSSVLTFATPLIVKHGRLLTAQRDYRLALDEVSNQLERLSILPPDDVSSALSDLKPSELIAAKLPAAELHGELDTTDFGRRFTLRLDWEGSHGSPMTVSLATWLPPVSRGRSEP